MCASATCATVAESETEATVEFLYDLQTRITHWPEADEITRVLRELNRVTHELQEELATMILRRVVPGRYKYCPF